MLAEVLEVASTPKHRGSARKFLGEPNLSLGIGDAHKGSKLRAALIWRILLVEPGWNGSCSRTRCSQLSTGLLAGTGKSRGR